MSSDDQFIDKQEDIADTNLDVEKEDKQAEESEVTGKVSSDEVEALKDDIGGGKVLDDSEGYTRSSNKDVNPMKQEQEIDQVVDNLE
ncbi:hypothetical protein BD324DRAFT_650802 [Kockovaella imperatae]|uniref:Uncharacterized protein n=1 Tax=Kockovaella imperatae TaxID=4999 RepID=A0A1Y1UJA2_9TREE|nr:hypothetical protein BD324DRAFT_650802 [Kockovaella imperatae]ORX37195.1 hypothetical protein BD324DRAFT_650802 [Kockovaella imperatae]